jgi:hypothetical protein
MLGLNEYGIGEDAGSLGTLGAGPLPCEAVSGGGTAADWRDVEFGFMSRPSAARSEFPKVVPFGLDVSGPVGLGRLNQRPVEAVRLRDAARAQPAPRPAQLWQLEVLAR